MRQILIAMGLCAALIFGCQQQTKSTSQPDTTGKQAAEKPESSAAQTPTKTDYAAEKYRIVNQPDEVVAVLENGATVIAKRMDSPVVAVRAYTYTGGVFEGK